MSKMQNQTTVSWGVPLPVWGPRIVGSTAEVVTYFVRNTGRHSVSIRSAQLVPGGDGRIQIVGGNCVAGALLPPRSSATIELHVDPSYVGDIRQVLRIQHTGEGPSSLWADIAFSIKERVAPRRGGSYLSDETVLMERERRVMEQTGHRQFGRVHAREHAESVHSTPAPEGELQNDMLQNPWLNSQRFDGIDPNLNPEPPLNTDARREFDNERREQEMEKQLRLGHMPKFSTAPKPQGP